MHEKRIQEILSNRSKMIKTHLIIIIASISSSLTLGFLFFKNILLPSSSSNTNRNPFIFIFLELLLTLLFILIIKVVPFFSSLPSSISNFDSKSLKNQYIIGSILSIIFGTSLSFIVLSSTNYYQFFLYLITLSIYHYAEYLSVLLYHFLNLSTKSYLIDHSKNWLFACISSFLESLIGTRFFHKIKSFPPLFVLGILLTITGQFFRISALFTGKSSFTHLIQKTKKVNHVLVTWGIYSISRHPSYFGFLLWEIGIQVMCGNVLCFFAFGYILFKFFKARIPYEEELLIEFFGYEYLKYRRKVPILIPFIDLDIDVQKSRLYRYLAEHPDVEEDEHFFDEDEKKINNVNEDEETKKLKHK